MDTCKPWAYYTSQKSYAASSSEPGSPDPQCEHAGRAKLPGFYHSTAVVEMRAAATITQFLS